MHLNESMHIYCVLVVCQPFFLKTDGKKVESGFFRNEYVMAPSVEKAIAVAKARTLRKMRRIQIEMIEDKPMQVGVDEIKTRVPISRLLRDEGFLFFPV